MEMRSGAQAGGPDVGHRLRDVHAHAGPDAFGETAEVAIPRDGAVTVTELEQVGRCVRSYWDGQKEFVRRSTDSSNLTN